MASTGLELLAETAGRDAPRQVQEHDTQTGGRFGCSGPQRRYVLRVEMSVCDRERRDSLLHQRNPDVEDESAHRIRLHADRPWKGSSKGSSSVPERGQNQNSVTETREFPRAGLRHGLRDDHVRTERQMWPMRLDRADGQDGHGVI